MNEKLNLSRSSREERATDYNKTLNITHLPFSCWSVLSGLSDSPGGISSTNTHSPPCSQTATLFTLRATLPYHASTYSLCVCAHPWQRRHTQSGTELPGCSASAWSKHQRASLCLKASHLCSILGRRPSTCPLLRNKDWEGERNKTTCKWPAQDVHTSIPVAVTVNHYAVPHEHSLPGEMKDKGDKRP